MSLRAPLGKVLGLGTARDGTDHWWMQRVSAVGLALLGLWFVGSLVSLDDLQYANAHAFIAAPLNSVLMLLLCATLAYHSYLGVQVVVEDYVHAPGIKVVALIASRFAHIVVAAASIYAILRIGLGA